MADEEDKVSGREQNEEHPRLDEPRDKSCFIDVCSVSVTICSMWMKMTISRH